MIYHAHTRYKPSHTNNRGRKKRAGSDSHDSKEEIREFGRVTRGKEEKEYLYTNSSGHHSHAYNSLRHTNTTEEDVVIMSSDLLSLRLSTKNESKGNKGISVKFSHADNTT